jgi:transposase
LQSDGYAAYGNLGSAGLLHFGCFAHARRKFFDASKLDPKDARSVAMVRAIGTLYEVEHRAREANLCAQEREALRAKECPALLKTLKERITKTGAEVLPKSALGEACTYALNQWERLERYPEFRS